MKGDELLDHEHGLHNCIEESDRPSPIERILSKRDLVKFLLGDIEDAAAVEIPSEDDWSFLFMVTLKDGSTRKGIYYKPTPCLPPEWKLEDLLDEL